MNRQVLMLGLLLQLLLIPCAVTANSPNQEGDFHALSDIDIWIDGLAWYAFWYDDLTTSYTIYVDFEVTSGGDIDFFICHEDEYIIWESGGTAYVYELADNVGSRSVEFHVQSSGKWYIIFENDALLIRKHIEGYLGLTPQPTAGGPSLDSGALMLMFLLVAVVAIAGGAKFVSGTRSKQPTSAYIGPQQPVQKEIIQPPSSPKSETQAFCPYCGTPRQPPGALFCSTCGKQFREVPDIQ